MKFNKSIPTFFIGAIIFLCSSLILAKSTVYIYNDEGVGQFSFLQTKKLFETKLDKFYNVKSLSAQETIDGQWMKDAIIFVMPGGADLPYVKKLSGTGNSNIKKFVQNGGSYLGICAGSYYGSSYVEFDKGGPLEVIGVRELAFYGGKAVGPALSAYEYNSHSGSKAAIIKTQYPQIPVTSAYYNGGAYFQNSEKYPNTKVIGTYENGLPAIIAIKYGRGRVLLSGVHFEYNPDSLDGNDEYLKSVITSLRKTTISRDLFIKELFKLIMI